MSMENFFNYISKPVKPEDVELWFQMNNMIPEKLELYYDFTLSLYDLMLSTYLGDDQDSPTTIKTDNEDNINHFMWCWEKTITNFKKESIDINIEGDHQHYFKELFLEIFYKPKDDAIKSGITGFFNDLFDLDKTFSQSDLDLLTTIYKNIDKNTTYNLY
jgi:hypothetical protein